MTLRNESHVTLDFDVIHDCPPDELAELLERVLPTLPRVLAEHGCGDWDGGYSIDVEPFALPPFAGL